MQRKTEELQMAIQDYFDVDWFSMKLYMRRQIAKCVTECKSQAANAKRIVGTLKHHRPRRKVTNDAAAANGDWESEEDSDYWDSDFDEDFDDESEATSDQISEISCSTSQTDKTDSSSSPVKEESIVSSEKENVLKFSSNVSEQSKAVITSSVCNSAQVVPHRNTISRPPIKRPPSGPPPPPVQRPQSQESSSTEEYEIPISHPQEVVPSVVKMSSTIAAVDNKSYKISYNHSSNVTNGVETAETYEVIEPVEENYEVVQSPPVPIKAPEKPSLPPRIAQTSINIPPPPLPLKPKKLQESVSSFQLGEISWTMNRQKDEIAQEPSNHSTGIIGSGILGSFLGRRNSNSSSSSLPRSNTKHRNSGESVFTVGSDNNLSNNNCEKDGFFTVGGSAFIHSSTVSTSSENLKLQPSRSENTAQNFATRPLPPVPHADMNSTSQQSAITSFRWFHEIEREDAELEIQNLNSSGAFLVRPSKRAGAENPYTLTILHTGRVFHLNIRLRPDGAYALGKEKKKEMTFQSVPDLVQHHQKEPILLTSRGEIAGQTILGVYPEK